MVEMRRSGSQRGESWGWGKARTRVASAKAKRINGWSKRGFPQQPQASDSIHTKFQNWLVRPVYLRTTRQRSSGIANSSPMPRPLWGGYWFWVGYLLARTEFQAMSW